MFHHSNVHHVIIRVMFNIIAIAYIFNYILNMYALHCLMYRGPITIYIHPSNSARRVPINV